MPRPTEQPCRCGSGAYPYALHDGHGIFLCYACDSCRAKKLAGYRPDILEFYDADEPIESE
jgi:hypothetical protein